MDVVMVGLLMLRRGVRLLAISFQSFRASRASALGQWRQMDSAMIVDPGAPQNPGLAPTSISTESRF
jgi:hypothetical protein